MEEIKVYVVKYADRKNLAMKYIDPLTNREVKRSTGTHRHSEAERIAAKWEHDLQEADPPSNRASTFMERLEAREAIVQKTYFIQEGKDGPIKIGRAERPRNRLRSLQTSNSSKLRLLAVINEDVEAATHFKFAKLRIRGEWFKPDPSLVEWIHTRGWEDADPGALCPWFGYDPSDFMITCGIGPDELTRLFANVGIDLARQTKVLGGRVAGWTLLAAIEHSDGLL